MLNRTQFLTIFSIIQLIILWTTPFIAYKEINKYLEKDVCDLKSSEPCCNGINEPNFILDFSKFSEKSNGNIIDGLYISIQKPTTQYWYRVVSINVIFTVLWIIFISVMYNCFYIHMTPGNPNPTHTIRYSTRNLVIIIGLLIKGFIASMTLLYGGPSFPYEFLGYNDSPVYMKNNNNYQIIDNLKIYKTFGTTQELCGGTPIQTSLIDFLNIDFLNTDFLNSPLESRTSRPTIIVRLSTSGNNIRRDPCEQHGLVLVANSNYQGIGYLGGGLGNPGPWLENILEAKSRTTVQREMQLKEECMVKMNEIIIFSSGNLAIPISYVLIVLISLLFPNETTNTILPSNVQPNRDRLPSPINTRSIESPVNLEERVNQEINRRREIIPPAPNPNPRRLNRINPDIIPEAIPEIIPETNKNIEMTGIGPIDVNPKLSGWSYYNKKPLE
jgi:hypothetical protein